MTPLHHALYKNYCSGYSAKDIIRLLCLGIEGEKAKFLQDNNLDTPLHYAIYYYPGIAGNVFSNEKENLEKQLRIKNSLGMTPEDVAYKMWQVQKDYGPINDDYIDFLRPNRKNDNYPDIIRPINTPLHIAVKDRNVDEIKRILNTPEGEKYKSVQDYNGMTPLHHALDFGKYCDKPLPHEIIELLSSGTEGEKAKILQDNNLKTPSDYAEYYYKYISARTFIYVTNFGGELDT